MTIYKKQQELLDAMNYDAKTEVEHQLLIAEIRGLRTACDLLLMSSDLRHRANMYYINQGIEADMCCGEFIPWNPGLYAREDADNGKDGSDGTGNE